jgi:hypothetical protein
MSWLQVVVYSPFGEPIEAFELPVPIGAEQGMVQAVIVPGHMHGPADVPCGHDTCRESLMVAQVCAEESAREYEERWGRAVDYDGWAD